MSATTPSTRGAATQQRRRLDRIGDWKTHRTSRDHTRSRPIAVPPWALALTAMFSVQLGSALSVDVIDSVGPAGPPGCGSAWAHSCSWPSPGRHCAQVRRADMPALVGLGVTTGLVTVAFLAAIERIPLGTAVADRVPRPAHRRRGRAAHSRRPLLGQPWLSSASSCSPSPGTAISNPAGVGFAALAALGWAAYIVLTQRVGDRFSGIAGCRCTIPVAALTAAVLGSRRLPVISPLGVARRLSRPGAPAARPALRARDARLRRMTPTAFGP